ncbi:MAG: hypothetical protein Q8N18_23380 [Opitutaceae bacterium]|nr:hypothetical protein [Opitutaceae bacterium]
MAAAPEDPAALLAAYRKAIWKMIGLGVFFALCFAIVFLARRAGKLPPAVLTLPLIAALLLFGVDLFRFVSLRRRVREMREASS